MIGDDIEVTVVSVSQEKVRLRIRAPSDIPVHRREIYLAIQEAPGEGGMEEASDPEPREAQRRVG